MLRTTPLHSRTAPLCQGQNWRRWAGFVVAGSYELTHDREYHAVRSSAALFDVSPLHKYRIAGPGALRLLNRVVTRDVSKCAVHQVVYTPWCDGAGKVRDDGTLARLEEDVFRLTSAEPNLRWLHDNARGLEVQIDDVSDSLGALALQGPYARAILDEASDGAVTGLGFFRMTSAQVAGMDVTVTRTGYTGDLGYEIWMEEERAGQVWDALMMAGGPYGIVPAGMLALDMVRVEAGLILLDVDYVPAQRAVIEDRKSSPYELGLGWTVKLDKSGFVGKSALVREKERGPEWQLRGIEVDWESLEKLYGEFGLPPQLPTGTWRTSVPVYAGRPGSAGRHGFAGRHGSAGKQVGYATSGCWSPLLKKYIALAHLHASHSAIGTDVGFEVTVEHRRRRARARVVDTPFFDPERKRGDS